MKTLGGHLILRHMGKKQIVDFKSLNIGIVAFYTDIEHEITPVTSGFRIAFTYNLFLESEMNPSNSLSRVLTSKPYRCSASFSRQIMQVIKK